MKRGVALWPIFAAAGMAAAQQTIWIQGMAPNWDQPYDYPDAFDATGPGPDPVPGGPSPWDAWCTPTSSAMLIGYLEDYKGYAGLADMSFDPNQAIAGGYGGPAWGNALNWRIWHDFTADGSALRGARNVNDLGWYLDTNNLGMNWGNRPHAGTYYKDVSQGLNAYLLAMGFPAGTLAASTYGVNAAFGGFNTVQLLGKIRSAIDADRTVIGHFSHWNIQGPGGPGQGNAGNTHEGDFGFEDYDWLGTAQGGCHDEDWNGQTGNEGLGHSVCVVGYTINNGAITHLIVHDNSPLTVRNVRVQVGPNLPQLVAFTDVVPEPGSLLALSAGLALLATRRRTKR